MSILGLIVICVMWFAIGCGIGYSMGKEQG
jgi:hypothetical protein